MSLKNVFLFGSFCFVASFWTLAAAKPIVPETTLSEEIPVSFDGFRSDLFEGDILGIDKYSVARNGIISPARRWPKKTEGNEYYFVYEISNSFTASEKAIIQEALNELNTRTKKIRIKQKTNTDTDYVFINKGGSGTGCSSYVGRKGNRQVVNLEVSRRSTCVVKGTVLHELVHAIGFHHEQTRTDRDSYVEINWNNIKPEMKSNFNKYENSLITSFEEPYDYVSVMGYAKNSFAINPAIWTIRPKAPWQNSNYGPGSSLSATDLRKIDKMYP